MKITVHLPVTDSEKTKLRFFREWGENSSLVTNLPALNSFKWKSEARPRPAPVEHRLVQVWDHQGIIFWMDTNQNRYGAAQGDAVLGIITNNKLLR